jgi:REP element-mobilizing transposase RayT
LREFRERYPGMVWGLEINPNGVASRQTLDLMPAMPQSLADLIVHLVFSTKNREQWFSDLAERDDWFAFIGGVSKQLDCHTLIVGGMPDHVHILAKVGRKVSISDWVGELKRVTSAWVKTRFPGKSGFYWQEGYAVFSVSQSNTDAVVTYIEKQEEHHAGRSFQDEFRVLLKRHQMEWDERYAWD